MYLCLQMQESLSYASTSHKTASLASNVDTPSSGQIQYKSLTFRGTHFGGFDEDICLRKTDSRSQHCRQQA